MKNFRGVFWKGICTFHILLALYLSSKQCLKQLPVQISNKFMSKSDKTCLWMSCEHNLVNDNWDNEFVSWPNHTILFSCIWFIFFRINSVLSPPSHSTNSFPLCCLCPLKPKAVALQRSTDAPRPAQLNLYDAF